MRVLSPIVQVSALPVLNVGKQVALGDAVAAQFVGHDHPRHVLQALQQPLEELLGSFGIPPVLHEDVERDAFLVDRAPEIVLHAPDPDEHLVEMPLVSGLRTAAAHGFGKALAKFPAPAPHGLIRDDDAPLREQELDIPQAEAEHMIQPDGMADNLSGEPMAIVRVGCGLHSRQSRPAPPRRPDPVTVTMPLGQVHTILIGGARDSAAPNFLHQRRTVS